MSEVKLVKVVTLVTALVKVVSAVYLLAPLENLVPHKLG